MKKIIRNKNRCRKIVNNQNTITYHKLYAKKHMMSKEWESIYRELTPIYEELDKDFQIVDMVDLDFYERWLNV